jgi:hypothetical protein
MMARRRQIEGDLRGCEEELGGLALCNTLHAAECLVDSLSGREDTRRKAVEVATSHNKTAHAVKNCGPLMDFFRRWELKIDYESLAFHHKHTLGDPTPYVGNAALSWAVFVRRVFSENKLPYDQRPEMEFERSVSLCLRQPHKSDPGAYRFRIPGAGEFEEFARELFAAIFPGVTLDRVDTDLDDYYMPAYTFASMTCTPRQSALTFRLSYTDGRGLHIGTLADHTNEGRRVEALAEFFTRRSLLLKSEDMRTLYRQILRQEPPPAATPSADAWAEFLKRVLDENELPSSHHSDVFERSMQLCLGNIVPYPDSFAAGLANLLFPRGAPCTMGDADDNNPSTPNQIMVPFRKHDDGPLFGFLFTVDQPGVEFGILV